MKNILPYKLFESDKALNPDVEEIMSELNKFPYADIFKSWFKLEPKKTGRIYVKGGYLPSVAYFEKFTGGGWYYIYSGAGRYYGQQTGTLQTLFLKLMKDSIKKGAPSYLNKKDVDSALSDDEWLAANMNEDPASIYKLIQQKISSDIILDFGDLEFPAIKNMIDMSLVSEPSKGNLGDVTFFLTSVYRSGPDKGSSKNKFWGIIDAIIRPTDSYYSTRLSKIKSITFYPKGNGVSARSTSDKMRIDVGAKTKEEAVDLIQKTLIKYMLKNDLIVSGKLSEEKRSIIDSLYKSAIESSAEGDMGSGQKLLDDYFSKNPLDLHVLDDMPDIKAGVLKRTGIRDLSRIGSIIGSNLL
jgi:hypothetical protein